MDIANNLNTAIEQMKENKKLLQGKIVNEKTEVEQLTLKMQTIANRIDTLKQSLDKAEGDLLQMSNTIEETESGYKKLVEAGETLMSIVSQNLTRSDPNSNSNSNSNSNDSDKYKMLESFKTSE